MVSTGKSETFIEQTSGCGTFQLILVMVVISPVSCIVSYGILFMSFGNYNPGWRCMDNVTTHDNTTSITDPYDVDYTAGSCDVYDQCHYVEFNPQTSTIVTEWGLLCDKSWIPSMMISIQMAGMLIFSYLSGQISDLIGRKTTLYGCIALGGILQLVSVFSVSWSMFAVILFFISGSSIASVIITMIYISEFMTMKWRAVVMVLPYWYLGALIQAITALITKDWRHIQIFGFALHVLCFISVFWAPESLRWLEVKRMSERFNSVAKKISTLNKTLEPISFDDDNSTDTMNDTKETTDNVKKYTLIDIFRHGYAMISICLGIMTMVFSMIFYSTTFGTKALYGDFYTNLVVTNAIAIPIFLLGLFGIRYMSRKRFTLLMLGIGAVCIFAATGLLFTSSEAAKSFGSTILIAVAKASVDIAWVCLYSRTTEIYPTVVRGVGVGYISVTARIGGILAPFIIPEDSGNLYIFTLVSGASILLACILNCVLPETKGKPLKENFESRIHQVELDQHVCKDVPLN